MKWFLLLLIVYHVQCQNEEEFEVDGFRGPIFSSCTSNSGEKGRCKSMEECRTTQDNPNPTLCGLDAADLAYTPVVCCNDINLYLKPSVSDWHFPGISLAEKACNDYTADKKRLEFLKREVFSTQFHCDKSSNTCYRPSFAAGGTDANIDEFPHMALLGWEKNDGSGYEWNCGGTLISERYVLTAAHCLYSPEPSLKYPEPTLVRFGDFYESNFTIESLIPHPGYKPPRKYDDIALIRLSQPVKFYLDTRPACLSKRNRLQGDATVIGWGYINEGGDRPNRLQKVDLNIYDDDTCKRIFTNARTLPNGIRRSQFCAGFREGGKDSCRGDSGGPIQIKDQNNIYEVLGIVSFGSDCGSSNGGVYTKVSHYLDWIESHVWS